MCALISIKLPKLDGKKKLVRIVLYRNKFLHPTFIFTKIPAAFKATLYESRLDRKTIWLAEATTLTHCC